MQDEDRMRYEGGQYYLKSPEEMQRLFPYAREAIENTGKIANVVMLKSYLENRKYQNTMCQKDTRQLRI